MSAESPFPPPLWTNDLVARGPRIDVRAFGANGDYISDDTAAVQNALDYAASVVVAQYSRLQAARPLADIALSEASAGPSVYFPAGRYRVAKTLTKFPGVSMAGDGPASILTFEPVLGTWDISAGTGIEQLTSDPQWAETRNLYAFLYVLPHVTMTINAASHEVYSMRDHISDLAFESRGNSVAILVKGTANNLRFRRLHLHGYGAATPLTANGIAFIDRFSGEPKSSVTINPPSGPVLTGTLPSSEGGWNTDGDISECFIEGFKVGIYGWSLGANASVNDCTVGNCVRGIKTANNTTLTIDSTRIYCDGTSWSPDTAIMAGGQTVGITNCRIQNFRAGMLLMGRAFSVHNNDVVLASDAGTYSTFDGHAIHCVGYNWQASGATYGDAGLPAKQVVSGADPAQDGVFSVHNILIDYLGTLPSGKKPIYFDGHTLTGVPAYNAGTTYSRGDRCSSGGVYYEYISYTPMAGIPLTNATYWRVLGNDRTLLFSCHGLTTHAVGTDPVNLIKWNGGTNLSGGVIAQPYFLMDENPLVRMPVVGVPPPFPIADQTVSSNLADRQLQNFVQFNFGDMNGGNRKLFLPDPASQSGRHMLISCYKAATAVGWSLALQITGSSTKLLDIASQTLVNTITLIASTQSEKWAVFELWCDGSNWYVRK